MIQKFRWSSNYRMIPIALVLGFVPQLLPNASADGDGLSVPCELIPQMSLAVADIQLRVERVYFEHATDGDLVRATSRLHDVNDVLDDNLNVLMPRMDTAALASKLGVLEGALNALLATQLKVKGALIKVDKEMEYLMTDILESTYKDEASRPYDLALATEKIIAANNAGGDKQEFETLLNNHMKALNAFCAPALMPCANPQYRSGERFANAARGYLERSKELKENFEAYSVALNGVQEILGSFITLQCDEYF